MILSTFPCACWPVVFLLWKKMSFQVFCWFFNWVVWFFDTELYELFIYFGPLIRHHTMKSNMEVPQKTKNRTTIWSSNCTPEYMHIENENTNLKICRHNIYIPMFISIVHPLSHIWLFWPHGLQHTRLPCPSPIPRDVQTHVHWVGDDIQPFHPLSSPSSPTFNLS